LTRSESDQAVAMITRVCEIPVQPVRDLGHAPGVHDIPGMAETSDAGVDVSPLPSINPAPGPTVPNILTAHHHEGGGSSRGRAAVQRRGESPEWAELAILNG
jgi:hypothetical protein